MKTSPRKLEVIPFLALVLIFIASTGHSNSNTTINPLNNEVFYASNESKKGYGTIEVASYSFIGNEIVRNEFEISIDGKINLQVNQPASNFFPRKKKIRFARIELPAGSYKLEITETKGGKKSDKNEILEIWVESQRRVSVVYDPIHEGKDKLSLSGYAFKSGVGDYEYEAVRLGETKEVANYVQEKESQSKEFVKNLKILRLRQQEMREESSAKAEVERTLALERKQAEAAQARIEKERQRQKEADEERKTEAERIVQRKQQEIERTKATQEAARKLREQQGKEDDAICQSYGAKTGTEMYVNCRVNLHTSRMEREDREKANHAMQEQVSALQNQLEIEKAERGSEQQKRDDERRLESARMRKFLEEESQRRQRAESREAAERWLEQFVPRTTTTNCVSNGFGISCSSR